MPCGHDQHRTGHCAIRIVAALLLCALPVVAAIAQRSDAADSVRLALLNGDYASAVRFLDGVASSSEREHLSHLIAEAEAHALAEEITRTLATGPARVASQTLSARMPALQVRLAATSPSLARLTALWALAEELAAAEPKEPAALPSDVQQALEMGTRELAGLVTRRATHRAAIDAAHREAIRLAGVTVEASGRDRVTDAQQAYAALERKLVELGGLVDAADLLFEAADANGFRRDARELSRTTVGDAGTGLASMFYFMRNFGDGRKAVEAALVVAPSDRRLIEIKVKIEEWQTRQRIWGDSPRRGCTGSTPNHFSLIA